LRRRYLHRRYRNRSRPVISVNTHNRPPLINKRNEVNSSFRFFNKMNEKPKYYPYLDILFFIIMIGFIVAMFLTPYMIER
jgi:hypothetical protein